MLKKIILFSSKILIERKAFAHCDIPCGIYDPHNAQLAAHTIIRMTELLGQIKRDDKLKAEHDVSRVTRVKENHASIVEEELNTLRNDYFKEEHFKEYPNLNELFIKTLAATGKARQNIDLGAAEEVLAGTQEIAEIFFKSKGVESVRVKTVYPTKREIVLHK